MAHVVKKSVAIRAPPEAVWDALTNPEKTKTYFFHAQVESDWKKGGPISFKGKMFWVIPFEMSGTILDIEPHKRLQYQLRNGKDENGSTSTVTDTLTFRDGITTVSVSDDVGTGEGAEKRYKRSVKGWDKILKGLKKTVEQEG